MADAAIGGALVIVHGAQAVDGVVRLIRRHPQAVDPAAVVARQVEMDAGDRRDRAGRAQQMETPAGALLHCLFGERPQLFIEGRDHVFERIVVDVMAAETLGERDDPEFDRGPDRDAARPLFPRAVGREPDDFGGPAADIEQQHAFGLRIGQRAAADCGQPRLGLPVDDLETQPGALEDALDEFLAIGRRAAGLRGDQAGLGHAAPVHLVAADFQRLQRALDGRLAETPRLRQAFAEAHDPRIGVDDAQALGPGRRQKAGRAGHQKAAIVRAEIESGIERRPAGAACDPPVPGTALRLLLARPSPKRRHFLLLRPGLTAGRCSRQNTSKPGI